MARRVLDCSKRSVDVERNHPLNRFFCHETPLSFHGIRATSVEAIFNYILLCQSDRKDLADQLLANATLLQDPANIRVWYEGLGVEPPADLIIASPDIYRDILMFQLSKPSSPFRKALKKEMLGMKSARKIKFRVFTNTQERILSYGVRKIEFTNEDDPCLGYNLYGKILRKVAKRLIQKRGPTFSFRGEKLVSDAPQNKVFGQSRYSKTLGLFSDSYCRNVTSIRGGEIVAIKGGRYDDIVDEIRQNSNPLREFQNVVINCGINVAQELEDVEDLSSLSTLGEILKMEAARRNSATPSILFSAPIWFPSARISYGDLQRHVDKIEEYFAGSGVLVLNWFNVTPNSFLDLNLNPIDTYMDIFDEFHLSHNGFRKLWKAWTERLEDLVTIGYKLSPRNQAVVPVRRADHHSGPSTRRNSAYHVRDGRNNARVNYGTRRGGAYRVCDDRNTFRVDYGMRGRSFNPESSHYRGRGDSARGYGYRGRSTVSSATTFPHNRFSSSSSRNAYGGRGRRHPSPRRYRDSDDSNLGHRDAGTSWGQSWDSQWSRNTGYRRW